MKKKLIPFGINSENKIRILTCAPEKKNKITFESNVLFTFHSKIESNRHYTHTTPTESDL